MMHAAASAMIGAGKEVTKSDTFGFMGAMTHAGKIDALLGKGAARRACG